MAAAAETTIPATRRLRKSVVGHGRENATTDISKATPPSKDRQKSRSKSMGPGGLDVLKAGTGNRRVSLAAPARPAPRSILKPAISQLQEIPPHKSRGGAADANENGIRPREGDENAAQGTKVAVRTEEEQHAAAREREERERAQEEKKNIDDRREARRKSLANRRVSFAAEATLHTFHEVEYLQDSTTSTDSTRRASSMAAQSPAHLTDQGAGLDKPDRPTTPTEQEGETVPESPANQRGLHQKKRRRSSGADAAAFSDAEGDTSHTTSYDSDSGDEVLEVQAEEVSDSSQDSDEEDGTMMTVDAEEMTSASMASVASAVSARSGSSANSTSDLDENLRRAEETARTGQRGVEGVASPQHGDDDDEEVIPAFTGWIKKSSSNFDGNAGQEGSPKRRRSVGGQDEDETVDVEMDMDLTGETGGILQPEPNNADDHGEAEMSMDVTSALGGIIAKPIGLNRAQNAMVPAQESPNDTVLGDVPMDLTVAVGAIRPGRISAVSDMDDNEDMSMELTTAVGGLLATVVQGVPPTSNRRRSLAPKAMVGTDDLAMDMTKRVGRMLAADGSADDADGDATIGMDMTMPLGGIIKPPSPARHRSGKSVGGQTEPQSPGLSAFRGKGLRRSVVAEAATSPANAGGNAAPHTPTRTPPRKMIGSRSTSPKRQETAVKKGTPKSPSKSVHNTGALFTRDPVTGVKTAKVVLTPQRRRLSGLGVDRSGLGSPKVAEMLDRRASLGEAAADFVPGQDAGVLRRRVAFEDPRAMAEELDRDRKESEEKESGRSILEREADGSNDEKDATLNLKEMIQSLSPKKNPARGRKSLHVGSARGVLGKRPAELDEDEDEDEDREDRDGVKRLRNHQGSPVKNVKLRSPPSKAETTGRVTRAGQKTLGSLVDDTTTPTTMAATSLQNGSGGAASPQHLGRYRDVEDDQPSTTLQFDRPQPGDGEAAAVDGEEDGDEQRIRLQDFLNMTNIRFLELTTTKRRHTVAPGTASEGAALDDGDDMSLERCVVAGACTVPMLELYQHSCRELKNYISGGRRIVKDIETDAFEENPPLFREYLSASPEVKSLMDNQFKNVKTHARLLSKAMWYEWRMKLQDGLKEGLVKIMDGMADDEKALEKQGQLLDQVLPDLVRRYESLERECSDLEAVAQELADCDPEDLQAARSELVGVDADTETQKREIGELERQLHEAEAAIGTLRQQKQTALDDIAASEKVREECRGWTSGEVAALKAKTEALEKQHGWAVTGIAGTNLSMTYRREIELVFDVSCFQPGTASNSNNNSTPLDLWYIAATRERDPVPLTPERDFMLQCIRDHARSLLLVTTTTAPSLLLRAVGAAWDRTRALARQLRLVRTAFRTDVARTSDSALAVRAALLLAPLQTRVDVVLRVRCTTPRLPPGSGSGSGSGSAAVEVAVEPRAEVVYGEAFNATKMSEFLAARIGPTLWAEGEEKGNGQTGPWVDVLLELQTKLLARGGKTAAS